MADAATPPPLDLDLDFFPSEIDLDSFFASIPDDPNFDFGADFSSEFPELEPIPDDLDFPSQESPEVVDKSPESVSTDSPTDSFPLWVSEIEQFLLEGGDEVEGAEKASAEEFFSDVFADGSGKSTVSNGDAISPESNAADVGEEEKEASEEKSGEDEEMISKKRGRQMRNRDSAMKSRERRKMYIQDLEKKSKFLESECRRLDHLLRCCAAENLVLRLHFQKDKATSVPLAKQESAVLFVESLLLGSLFWLVSTVFLFLVPNLLAWSPELLEAMEKARGLGEGLNQEIVGAKRLGNKKLSPGSELVFMRRRNKALKTKMKILLISSA